MSAKHSSESAAVVAGSVALVTAGARRLGRNIALKLAELGCHIALHYNSSSDEAEQTAVEVRKKGRECMTFQRNFSHIDEVLTLIPEIRETMGSPSILINNASVFEKNTLIEARPEEFDLDFNVHVKTPFFLTRTFANSCERGQIINIVDTAVRRFKTEYFTYLLSKKALLDLTEMAAAELAPRIRVNAIAPGLIIAPAGLDRASYQRSSVANPLQRAGSPADVIPALEYLLLNEQVTGECLFVDGGDLIDH